MTNVANCIFWNDVGGELSGTPNVTYSDIQGGFAGPGNINADPQFIDAAGGDYHLQNTSPCIDAANGTAATLSDFDGNGRVDVIAITNTGIGTPAYTDMGAYENQGTFAGKIIFVDAHSSGLTEDGLAWATAFRTLQGGLALSR